MSLPDPFFDELDAELETTADAEGLSDIDAGRVISHETMAAWLATWGTSEEGSPPDSWFE